MGKRPSVYFFLLINFLQPPPSGGPVIVWEEEDGRASDQKTAGKSQEIMEPIKESKDNVFQTT